MANDTSKKKSKNPRKTQPAKEPPDEKFLVVGLGASAGGIQALKEFFTRVPRDSGMAYVVILHMSPEHESRLAEILQVTSPIPVTQVRQRIKVEPDHVYVIPPNQNLVMSDGHLALTHMIGAEERRSPVDLFFRTLAESNEDRSISVILSGTGANGSMGVKRIKEYGGVAFVQDPAEAEYKDMPRNAIATGIVDHVLPVAEIPAKIISYKDHLSSVQIPKPQEVPRTDEQALMAIFTQLRKRTGQDFSNYKRATVLRRIERRLVLRELRGLPEYAQFLLKKPQEVQALMKDLLISVTNFFRDPESIESLKKNVIPKIFQNKDPNDPVRVWVAGCATGEEAYSIAMLLSEYATDGRSDTNLQIFATDLDQEALKAAREGYYNHAEVADVSPERLRRFFTGEAEGYRVRRELRETILFAPHNLIKDPPFLHLDLVSCRNLLIYLNRTAQNRVLELLHFALNPSGYVFLGASESIEGASDLFSVMDKEHHIFRSRPVPSRAFPLPEITFRPSLSPVTEREKTQEEKRAMERLSNADLHQRLLEQYGPPSVVVNEEYDIVHLSDRAGRYLQITGGTPSHNLLKIVRPELRLELRAALYQAMHDRINVEARSLRVSTNEGFYDVNILVRPVLRDEDVSRGFVLVLFEEVEPSDVEESRLMPPMSEPLARRLEDELVQSKGQLRATVEQYEVQQEELRASNEELQAMNEELRSAAEELETSKEELQSVNEELTTVNQELKIKIEELSQANNNFTNLMNSTNIGTVFLDRALKVRQFTPSARKTFNLISTDIGRPLMDITTKLKIENLSEDINSVLVNLHTIEREVQTLDDRSFMIRLLPYRTLDERIDGVVITMVDVTERTRAREALRRAGEELEARVAERTRELADANESLRLQVAETKRSEDSRMDLLAQLVSAQEDERRRFALDLHDQLGQQLTSLRLKLESLETHEDGKTIAAAVEELQAIVKQLDDDVDFLAWQLRPVALDDLGLAAALANYVREWSAHFGIEAEFRAGDLKHERLDPQIETNLYRIAQEALNNCAKHSKCSRAEVLLDQRDHHAVLIIEDNGIGFRPQGSGEGDEGGLGLIGMRERSALLRGAVEIESNPNEGTTIFVRVPLTGGGASSKKKS